MGPGARSVGLVSRPIASPVPGSLSAEEKRAALEEVLRSSVFRRADQLRKFLSFICEMEITGRADELCEYLIGVEALGRPSDYSPAEDAAVRRRAADLREKLHETYSDELSDAKIRIDLPKGTYVPRFISSESSLLKLARTPIPAIPLGPPVLRPTYFALVLAFVMGMTITGLAFLGLPSLRSLVVKSGVGTQPHPGMIYEAEATSSTMAGSARTSRCSACSGGQKVGFIGNGAANFLAINDVTVAMSGPYQLQVDYLLRGTRSFFISVNDGPGVELPLTSNSWTNPASATVNITLKAGHNRIVFYNEISFAPDLDRVVLR